MDLHTITAVRRPVDRAGLGELGPGTAPLAGGTWLFSEPQDHLHTLVDLMGLGWAPFTVSGAGLTIGATCTFAELADVDAPWAAAPLLGQCCRALAGSFKIWQTATVGGNLCLGLPAGPMTSLAAALDGVAVVWTPARGERLVPVSRFVTGDRRTALARGELLRAVQLPVAAVTVTGAQPRPMRSTRVCRWSWGSENNQVPPARGAVPGPSSPMPARSTGRRTAVIVCRSTAAPSTRPGSPRRARRRTVRRRPAR